MPEENDPDGCYYRVILTREDLVRVITMQWFDENDYDQSKFVKDESGDSRQWETEDEARKFVNATYRFERIHPDDRTPDHADLLKPV